MDNDNLIEMRGITKTFPGIVALDDVSIDLKKGEILSLVGENGAGKTTLMKILSGDYSHGSYGGEIIMEGVPLRISSPGYAEKAGIAMIYQQIHVELDLSVAENIFLGILPQRMGFVNWKKNRLAAREVLDRLKVNTDPDDIMRNLNTSMQQLVCIARALVRNPKVLILDEPSSALTEGETRNLLDILNKLRESGISCIYISHKLKEVFETSDRVVVMRDARYVRTYYKGNIDSKMVVEDMIGHRIDSMYPPMEGREISQEVLRIENFKVQHPGSAAKNIIEDVSFTLHKGEVLGLAGLVGSGRSELLRAIFGAMPHRSGKIFIEGKEHYIPNTRTAIRKGIGFLTEDRKKDGFVDAMNIEENMTLSILKDIARAFFIDKMVEDKKVRHYFDMLKIKAPSVKTQIINLSGGNQQKVVLAKSLLTNMKILFLDEPTVGIDVGAKAEIYKIIKKLAESGLSIVMVSSEYPELLAMCDRFVIIANGYVAGELSKSDASETAILHMASGL
ncbi:MAG: sugar ABC transporter ATP-binding protein [Treponema sp.]|jgi:ABC-type sugar transport system ATPase subunit|nr:sugar ABC transporter ATP-binding protein [Treponema sp.]